MNLFLVLSYLFFLGSISGWCLELLFRKFFSKANPEHKWINPGFCTGPYLPIYGFGLCTLFGIAVLASYFELPTWALIILITLCMTLIEYIAGLVCLKVFKLRLWDYSHIWGNIQGLICPLFSFFWGILGIAYYFCIHPYIIDAIYWLAENLAFSFVIGFFFGVFTIDVVHSANLVNKIKKIANDKLFILHLENAKSHINKFNLEHKLKPHFLLPFKTDTDYAQLIKGFYKKSRHLK